MIRLATLLSLLIVLTVNAVRGQEYKQLPPPGIQIDADARHQLQVRIDQLRSALPLSQSRVVQRIPDVEVLIRAVRLALQQDQFFKSNQVDQAHQLLDEASRRLERYRDGIRGLALLGLADRVSDQPQLLVGGFVSRVDDSVQPFGLVVPAGYRHVNDRSLRVPQRMDVWLHGRGDTKTEIPFLVERMTKVGQYAPKDTFVLHPFGRHCNAFKFAGETDVYEAIEHLHHLINVDPSRVSIRGFSMGGAGCWHLAVHDPGRWFAANPGAGFVDTIVYQGWADKSPLTIDETQRKLLLWYDVLPWTSNLSNTRVIAYSGEIDKQRQAADRVIHAANQIGLRLDYVIGKKMGHKIDATSAKRIDAQIDRWAASAVESPRASIDFVTYTLNYNRVDWLQITGMKHQWSPARVRAELIDHDSIRINTDGVTGIRLDFAESGTFENREIDLTIDDDRIRVPDLSKRPGLNANLILEDQWYVLDGEDATLRKRPGLHGPIDHAFCDRFVFVIPSRPATHGVVQRWIDREIEYAQLRWKRLMRGEVRVIKDTEVTAKHIANNHLICFGDFSSNQYLRSVADLLPIQWDRERLVVGAQEFDPMVHAAAFCFPNPRNRARYVVVNSGMTFREFSNNSNSRQIAMLPDWAVFDVSDEDGKLAGGMFAGEVVADGFFDEQWSLPGAVGRKASPGDLQFSR